MKKHPFVKDKNTPKPPVDAKVMRHRDTEMIIKVYNKYIENAGVSKGGSALNSAFQEDSGNREEE